MAEYEYKYNICKYENKYKHYVTPHKQKYMIMDIKSTKNANYCRYVS